MRKDHATRPSEVAERPRMPPLSARRVPERPRAAPPHSASAVIMAVHRLPSPIGRRSRGSAGGSREASCCPPECGCARTRARRSRDDQAQGIARRVSGGETGVRGIQSQFATGRGARLVNDPEPQPLELEPRELGEAFLQLHAIVVAEHRRPAAGLVPRPRRASRHPPSRPRARRHRLRRPRATSLVGQRAVRGRARGCRR